MKHIFLSLLLIVPLSLLSGAAWYVDIYFIGHRDYSNWMRRDLYTSYFSILLSVICMLTPFMLRKSADTPAKNYFFAGLFQYCVSFIAWFIFKSLLAEGRMVRKIERLIGHEYVPLVFGTTLFLLPIVVIFVYWISIHKAIRKIHFANTFLFLSPFFLSIIMTLFSYMIFYWEESRSFNPEIVFKNGFPVGFMTFFMGVCGIIISRQQEYIRGLMR